jgi:hypothetical protein
MNELVITRTDPDGPENKAAGIFLSRLLERRTDGRWQKFGLADSELYDLHELVKQHGGGWELLGDDGGGFSLVRPQNPQKLVNLLECANSEFPWAGKLAEWTRQGNWQVWV